MAELTCEPRWAFGAGVGNGNASVLSRASMVDEPSTLKIELIYWPATTFAARAEAQAALFRYIDGWQKPRRIEQLSISVDQDLLCGGLLRGRFVGAFDEFAVLELRAGADERDQVWRVDGAPA